MNYTHQTELIIWEGEEEIELAIIIHFDWSEAELEVDYPAQVGEMLFSCDNPIFDESKMSEQTRDDFEKQCYKSMFNDSYDDRD